MFLACAALNGTKKVNPGNAATEDPPPAKKTRKCQKVEVKKEPESGGKADKDGTEDEQGGRAGKGPWDEWAGGLGSVALQQSCLLWR